MACSIFLLGSSTLELITSLQKNWRREGHIGDTQDSMSHIQYEEHSNRQLIHIPKQVALQGD